MLRIEEEEAGGYCWPRCGFAAALELERNRPGCFQPGL
jgi:hypothetical protein